MGKRFGHRPKDLIIFVLAKRREPINTQVLSSFLPQEWDLWAILRGAIVYPEETLHIPTTEVWISVS